MTILKFILLPCCLTCIAAKSQPNYSSLKPATYSSISMSGELQTRALRNYDRLESDIYTPARVFPVKHEATSEGWPGDYEGRIILGLTLEAQATHREPKYLTELINLIPQKVNEKGYLGPILKDSILEQQLSGHGWFLRALCEYYEWKKDPKVKGYIENIIQNLALPTAGYHKIYPIDPAERNKKVGAEAGSTVSAIGRWQLSSDIGCDFIFLDGVVHAYKLFPSPQLKALIDEMIARFLEIDLRAINAQTHATLTALRAMLRYYDITREPYLLIEAEKRFQLYKAVGMTADYENFNWFGRPTWTEPCAIVDSYLTAVQLWQFTGNSVYLEDAHHIYYNAIANTQRSNGGFGLSNCPGPKENVLKVSVDEAYWCCTMRGGEGLAKAIQYNYFTDSNRLVIPFFNTSEARLSFNNNGIILKEESSYPFAGKVSFKVLSAEKLANIKVLLFAPSWTSNHRLAINGKNISFKKENGFVSFTTALRKDTKIELTFDLIAGFQQLDKSLYNREGLYTFNYGPLLLGYEGVQEISLKKNSQLVKISNDKFAIINSDIRLTPVYHLLDSSVNKKSGYHQQILFGLEL